MDELTVTLGAQVAVRADDLRARVRRAWERACDDRGVDESVSKMIWLGVGVALAIAAGAFVISTFNAAEANVPDPVAPTP